MHVVNVLNLNHFGRKNNNKNKIMQQLIEKGIFGRSTLSS